METPTLNIIGKKSDFLKDIAINQPSINDCKSTPHRYGCGCEDCEQFLYYYLEQSRQ